MLFSCSVGYRANASNLFFGQSLQEVFSETRIAPILFPKTPEDLGRAGALSLLRLSSRSALMRRVFANGGI